MSREIDERVVQMKFEAGTFNRNIQTSIHNLEELKKGLDFKNAINGFADLDKAAQNTDISALGSAVEKVQVEFGMFEVFTLNVMNRISNAAINAGENLVKSLTIDQITPGWEKYADKTGSVQTIMAATAKQFADTGEQMEYVNGQLDKLNWFTANSPNKANTEYPSTEKLIVGERAEHPKVWTILRPQDRLCHFSPFLPISLPKRKLHSASRHRNIGAVTCRNPWSRSAPRTQLNRSNSSLHPNPVVGESWTLRSADTPEKSEENTLCPHS